MGDVTFLTDLLSYFGAFAFGMGVMILWLRSVLADKKGVEGKYSALLEQRDKRHLEEIDRYAKFVTVSENQQRVIEQQSSGNADVKTLIPLIQANHNVLVDIKAGLELDRQKTRTG